MADESDKLGFNSKLIKQKNRLLALKLIATQREISRAEVAVRLNLSKAASGKIVADLIQEGLICQEERQDPENGGGMGRKPILLKLSEESPCIFGVLIKRGVLYTTLADFSGSVFDQEEYTYEADITEDKLIRILIEKYEMIRSRNARRIIAIGISSVGPIDAERGYILNPPNFYGMKNIPVCNELEKYAQIPCYIINDSNSGALAEKLYGQAKEKRDFIYLHVMNGIGSGCVLGNRIYTGVMGQCGEIGHTSINAWGPRCACGNTGCLELYANLKNMNARMYSMRSMCRGLGQKNSLPVCEQEAFSGTEKEYEFGSILESAEAGDIGAIAAVEEFGEYLSVALTNMINILNVNTVILGYDDHKNTRILETILEKKINERALIAPNRKVEVKKSVFQGNAPLYGAIALITNKIFEGEVSF